MTSLLKPAAAALLATLLASCGGESPVAATSKTVLLASATVRAPVPADYDDVLQRIYVAYFGRPADPDGLVFFANNYLNAGAPTVIGGMNAAYAANPAVRALIDSFATSQESQDLYPGDNLTFIAAIYRNLFNREPDQAGLAYWSQAIDSGAMSRASAAVAIMSGAIGADLDLINKKNVVAAAFTNALDTQAERAAYSGLAANVTVRNMLATVTLATDPAAFQQTIDSTIAALVPSPPGVSYAQVAAIIQARCVGCHSSHPTISGFSPAPLGIRYDTSQQIHADATRIKLYVVDDEYMPYGNITGMTAAERTLIAQWYAEGAP
jgi:hypothetical protein